MTREEQLKYEYVTKLTALKKEQSTCAHSWGPVKYDPETERVPAAYEYTQQGVDFWPTVTEWKEKKIDRWSRTCTECGKVQYTKEQTAKVIYEPKFN